MKRRSFFTVIGADLASTRVASAAPSEATPSLHVSCVSIALDEYRTGDDVKDATGLSFWACFWLSSVNVELKAMMKRREAHAK